MEKKRRKIKGRKSEVVSCRLLLLVPLIKHEPDDADPDPDVFQGSVIQRLFSQINEERKSTFHDALTHQEIMKYHQFAQTCLNFTNTLYSCIFFK